MVSTSTHSHGSRRNRDRALPREVLPSAFEDDGAASTPTGTPPTAGSRSIEKVIVAGHRWLRFPRALEEEFQQASLRTREKLHGLCGLVALVSFWFASSQDALIAPESMSVMAYARPLIAALMIGSIALLLTLPEHVKKAWYLEAGMLLNILAINSAIIWIGVSSQTPTAIAHTVSMLQTAVYAGMMTRQRFWWTLTGIAVSFAGYLALVHGSSPELRLMVAHNIRVFVVVYSLVLIANYAFEHRERRAWLLRKLNGTRRDALVDAGQRLRRLSQIDPLTGLYNRRQFDVELQTVWNSASRAMQPICVLAVDVDFFKLYNDNYGHPAGDACLERVAAALSRISHEEGGVAARLGGEEFALLLSGHSQEGALRVGHALCAAVRDMAMVHRGSGVAPYVTVSVGVAQALPGSTIRPDALLEAADRALYGAKQAGRDQVMLASWADHAEAGDRAAPAAPSLSGLSGLPAQEEPSSVAATSLMPDTVPAPVSSDDLDQVLKDGFRWLRFPKAVEAAYQMHGARNRRRHLFGAALLGLFLFNSFIFLSRPMFPDVDLQTLLVLPAISGVLLLLMPLLFLPWRPWINEALYALGVSIMGVAGVITLTQSHTLTSKSYVVTLFFVPLFAGVIGRQPFWFALLPSIATVSSGLILLRAHDATQALILRDSLFMVANATLYNLIAAYTLDLGARKEWLLKQSERRRRDALTEATHKLHALSLLDPLTGLGNRRQFETDFSSAWTAAQRQGKPVSILIMDVDFFKPYNDNHGHPAGDRCLKRIAAILADSALGARGFAARLGGEEFCILLPGRGLQQAVQVGQSVCAAVRQARLVHGHSPVSPYVTISVGVACMNPRDGHGPSRHLLAAADDALYRAKTSGRNRVAIAAERPAA